MGQLKGQKLNHKHLMSTPEFKEHSLHHLEPHFQQSVLKKVLNEEMSLSEMKRGAADFHSLRIVYQPFYDSPAGLRQRSNFLHLHLSSVFHS